MTTIKATPLDDLRRTAEAMLTSAPGAAGLLPVEGIKELFHELQVHQIELELQNEELRSAHRALEKSRARFMRLYHDAPVGYVVLDSAGMIVEANAAFSAMVRWDRAEIIGRPFSEFLVGKDRPIFLARSKAFFKSPAGKRFELQLDTRSRQACHVSLSVALERPDEDADVSAIGGRMLIVTDITARVEVEQALSQSEQFAHSVVDALAAHIAILDATGRIVAVNRAWRDFARENQANPEAVNENANYLTVCMAVQGNEAKAARQFADGIVAVLRGELPAYTQEYACHSPGENRWFIGRVTPFPDMSIGRVVVAHENITSRKQMETENLLLQRQLNRTEKEESLGRMAGAIAHHFNNLLFVILGNIELAMEDAPPHSPLIKSLGLALDGTNRAAEISSKMLTYLGMNTRDKEAIDLSTACRQGLTLLQAIMPATAVLETAFPASGPTIIANPSQIQQLLAVLTENAWESCGPNHCRIHLAISTVAAEAIDETHRYPLAWHAQSETYACLEVMDNGCGIDDAHLEMIFDPFFTNKFTGRGMGLAMVLGILRAHNGCVTMDSIFGQGSTFRIYFPMDTSESI